MVSNYLVISSSSFCCVQDLQSQKLIGTNHREKGLYILDELKVSIVDATAPIMAFSSRSYFVFSLKIFSIHRSFRKIENL